MSESEKFWDDLEQTLFSIKASSLGNGIVEWLKLYQDAYNRLGLEVALQAKSMYAGLLYEMGEKELAREADREIHDELDQDEIDENFLISERTKFALLEHIWKRSGTSQPEDGDASRHSTPEIVTLYPEAAPRALRRWNSFSIPASPIQITRGQITTDNGRLLQNTQRRTSADDMVCSTATKLQTPSHQPTTWPRRKTNTDDWFKLLEDVTHGLVYGKERIYKLRRSDGNSYNPIKIAILDSGIAYTKDKDKNSLDKHMEIQNRVEDWSSFITGEDKDQALNDEVGHGTVVAYQVVKTTLTAKIYIARVVGGKDTQWQADEKAVADAIRHSADPQKWGVDIINMSFGFDKIDDEVRSAIRYASSLDVLMFAATSNFGLTSLVDILYPASAAEVIAVDAADGHGHVADFHAPIDAQVDKTRFTAPGMEISSPISNELEAGASFATPIAVGIAALILEFASQQPLSESPDVLKRLKEKDCMILILKAMTKVQGNEKFLFLSPWTLLGDHSGDRGSRYGGDGSVGTPRYFVGYDIVKKLRTVFKTPVGVEAYPIKH